MRAWGRDPVLTREPGGAPGAEDIRRLLVEGDPARWSPRDGDPALHGGAPRPPRTDDPPPRWRSGRDVVTDRFADSTRVYQGTTRGDLRALVDTIHAARHRGGAGPDADPRHGTRPWRWERGLARSSGEDRFEEFGLDFQTRLRAGFLALAQEAAARCVVIDAMAAPEDRRRPDRRGRSAAALIPRRPPTLRATSRSMSEDVLTRSRPPRRRAAPARHRAPLRAGHGGRRRFSMRSIRAALPHAWLLTGPKGVGKATFAWRAARYLIATPPDTGRRAVRGRRRRKAFMSTRTIPVARRPAAALSRSGPPASAARLGHGAQASQGATDRRTRCAASRGSSRSRRGGTRRVVIVGLRRRDERLGGQRIAEGTGRSRRATRVMLLVSHQPSGLLPTIRSRCPHAFASTPLGPAELAAALETGGPCPARRRQRAGHRGAGPTARSARRCNWWNRMARRFTGTS